MPILLCLWLVFFTEVCFYVLLFAVCIWSNFWLALVICMVAFVCYDIFHGGAVMFLKRTCESVCSRGIDIRNEM